VPEKDPSSSEISILLGELRPKKETMLGRLGMFGAYDIVIALGRKGGGTSYEEAWLEIIWRGWGTMRQWMRLEGKKLRNVDRY